MVKFFLEHMLNIRDRSKKEKLFNFIKGLIPLTSIKLQRQKLIDLDTKMGAGRCLMDYLLEPREDWPKGNIQSNAKGNRPFKPT